MKAPLLTIEDARVRVTGAPDKIAVDGVDVAIGAGEVVGLVGESGCGKSVTALSTLGLLPPSLAPTAPCAWAIAPTTSQIRRSCRAARPGPGHGVPGPWHVPQPGHAGRPTDRRRAASRRRTPVAAAPAPAQPWSCWSGSGVADAGPGEQGLSLRALRRNEAAGADRDGARLPATSPDRRRTDHRPRCHRPGPDHRPAEGSRHDRGDGHPVHLPRPGAGRRVLPADLRHVRRPGRGARTRGHGPPGAQPSLHRRPGRLPVHHERRRPAAAHRPGRRPRTGRRTQRMSVRSALRPCPAGVPQAGSAAAAGRGAAARASATRSSICSRARPSPRMSRDPQRPRGRLWSPAASPRSSSNGTGGHVHALRDVDLEVAAGAAVASSAKAVAARRRWADRRRPDRPHEWSAPPARRHRRTRSMGTAHAEQRADDLPGPAFVAGPAPDR